MSINQRFANRISYIANRTSTYYCFNNCFELNFF